MANLKELKDKLAALFPPQDVGVRVGSMTKEKNRGIALFYIDARNVMNRLDETVGVENWRDEYEVLPNGNVQCTLYLFDDEMGWVGKTDVGGQSDQEDAGDKTKSAYSDALKRAAVKWGIGRYLYEIPNEWHDLDQYKRFKATPKLPPKFVPEAYRGKAAAEPPAKPVEAEKPKASKATPNKESEIKDDVAKVPKNGKELKQRLEKAEKDLKGLFEFVVNAGELRGFPEDITRWEGKQLGEAMFFGTEFQNRIKHRVRKISQEQHLAITNEVGGDHDRLIGLCLAAQVVAPDFLTEAEASEVLKLIKLAKQPK